ncbi:hypothetical protein AV530_015329 [Patagioenas fasciata monilis]|uniref:Uncharacterized protein n=1 Tax=Patagioenas fasciata monilis TaxID=372326 RepID=A0A1V4K1T2_PATFA|nr:hypothetical protein AV530_015329 [Patagioenas fasciata monilis]
MVRALLQSQHTPQISPNLRLQRSPALWLSCQLQTVPVRAEFQPGGTQGSAPRKIYHADTLLPVTSPVFTLLF